MIIEYINTGKIRGVLTKPPVKLSDSVLTLMLKIEEPIKDGEDERNRTMFPDFVAYKEMIDRIEGEDLKVGSVLELDYTLETKRKQKEGENKYFKNNVITDFKVVGYVDLEEV